MAHNIHTSCSSIYTKHEFGSFTDILNVYIAIDVILIYNEKSLRENKCDNLYYYQFYS